MNALFTDGGLIQRNPSPIGGTWAWIRTEGVESLTDARGKLALVGAVEVARGVGLLLPNEIGLPTVSNNNTELYALLMGIAALPEGWSGTIYSDSLFALGIAFRQFKADSVPNYLRLLSYKVLGKAMERGIQMENVLLAGHPSKADLEAGRRLSKAPHYPVSPWNVACDEACTKRGQQYQRVLAHREIAQEASYAL